MGVPLNESKLYRLCRNMRSEKITSVDTEEAKRDRADIEALIEESIRHQERFHVDSSRAWLNVALKQDDLNGGDWFHVSMGFQTPSIDYRGFDIDVLYDRFADRVPEIDITEHPLSPMMLGMRTCLHRHVNKIATGIPVKKLTDVVNNEVMACGAFATILYDNPESINLLLEIENENTLILDMWAKSRI